MFSVHPISPRSGFLPVAVTDSVLTSVAGSGLTSPLGSVFSRTAERTPFSRSHRRSARLSGLAGCAATDPYWSRVSPGEAIRIGAEAMVDG